MKKIVAALFAISLFWGCNTNNNSFFKLTLTNEPNPQGLFPEYFEVSSEKQLVFLTNRFNTEGEKYQRTYFIELSDRQCDSVTDMAAKILLNQAEPGDTNLQYKFRWDVLENGVQESHVRLAGTDDPLMDSLFNYCFALTETHKRYKLKHSYSFNTGEICIVKKE